MRSDECCLQIALSHHERKAGLRTVVIAGKNAHVLLVQCVERASDESAFTESFSCDNSDDRDCGLE